ncbi:MAG: ribosome recycling factor [Planctomycetales bacterium]
MSAEDILFDVEERMEKAVDVLKRDLAGIRTGRANPGLVDSLRVEVYGSQTPIKQLASISCPEAQQILIRPFDPGTIKDIEKAVIASELGLTPISDGRVIRLNIPALTQEVRRKLAARIRDLTETAKVAVRNIRRDGNKSADQAEKDKTLSEDGRDTLKDEIQELTKKSEGQASQLAKTKDAEVMDA